ncbi:MAG: beta-lactamase domain-containing protein [Elusimicrobia bacterium]|nr:MAG: beta-lactamase domain-containing protein [Elusimicrobiota bacterium]KAF0152338.1 MAG: beta-lactamase domain-containing protein [Elusimicrobiota bacterium]
MKITVHRGAGEIGGNCIELQSGESRILLDYGAPLPKIDSATRKSVQATPEETILDIPGLYEPAPAPLDGIIISHTHQDHYGGLFAKKISPAVPVYMTAAMEELIRLTAQIPRGGKDLDATIRHYRKGEPFMAGAFKLTPYLMDHSASESFGFLIEADGRRVVYTGDFREHGNKKRAFEEFLSADMGKVDLLITEGTQAAIPSGPSEPDVMRDIESLVAGRDGALYVMCSGQNVDLLSSLGGIAEKQGRFLVLDGYIVLVLELLQRLVPRKSGRPLQIPGIGKKYLKIINTSATGKIAGMPRYREICEAMKPHLVSWEALNANIGRAIIPVRTSSTGWINKHIRDFSGAMFVYSMWNGYRVEAAFEEALRFFKAKGLPEFLIHASGHAYFSAIRKVVEARKPRRVLPVHTEHPGNFAWAFGDRVTVLKNGGSLEI